jgi:hypothetical protein
MMYYTGPGVVIPGYGVATGNIYRDIADALTLTTDHWIQEAFLP